MEHAEVKGDSGDNGCRNGPVDLEEDGDIVGAVNARRLLQSIRDGLEIGAHKDHIPDIHQIGDDIHPEGVGQAHVADKEVGGDQAAAEVHGDQAEEGIELPARQILAGKAKRQGAGNDQTGGGAHKGTGKGDAVGLPDHGVGEHLPVVGKGRHTRVYGYAAQNRVVRIVQRYSQRVQEGVQRGYEHRDHEDPHDYDNNIVAEHLFGFHLMSCFFYTCHKGIASFLLLVSEQGVLTGLVGDGVCADQQHKVDQ